MNAPVKKWRGLTWVGWINLLLLRWFCIRLAYELKASGHPAVLDITYWSLTFRAPWRW